MVLSVLHQQLAIPKYVFVQLHGQGTAQWAGNVIIHRDIASDMETIVDEFAWQNPWRLQLCNPPCTDKDD